MATLLLLLMGCNGYSFATCITNLKIQDEFGLRDYVHKVMDIDIPDRQFPGQYGKESNMTDDEIEQNFGAVGNLDCGSDYNGSAPALGSVS